MILMVRTFLESFISIVMALIVPITTALGINTQKPQIDPSSFDNVENVILLIGDGMGPLHLEAAKQERNITLALDEIEIEGRSRTRSASSLTTDSAAGGSALACGTRIINSTLGVYWYDVFGLESKPLSITELCQEAGMKTGIITTDDTSGATPSAFSVHTFSRNNKIGIDSQQLKSDLDLIWGGASDYVTKEKAEENGFTFVSTYSEMMDVEAGERSYGQFENSTWHTEQTDAETPTLSQMAEKAIDILDDGDEGFFLMIEGAHIDKRSHDNDMAEMAEALEEFDNTVREALEFAEKDGNTLVVVTADHETGGIVLNDDGSYSYTKGSHSSADVPVFVYGSHSFIENGQTVENYEIPIRIAYSLGFDEDDFPKEIFNAWIKNTDL